MLEEKAPQARSPASPNDKITISLERMLSAVAQCLEPFEPDFPVVVGLLAVGTFVPRHYPFQSVVRLPYRLSTALPRYVARVNEPNCFLCQLHPHHILNDSLIIFLLTPLAMWVVDFCKVTFSYCDALPHLCFSTLVGLHIVSATIRYLVNDIMKCRLANNAEYTGERPKFEFHLLFYVIVFILRTIRFVHHVEFYWQHSSHIVY